MATNGKRYDDDLIVRRFSNGDLIKPKDEVLKEIKKAFFPEPSHPKAPGVYFYVHDLEIADSLGCWDKEYYYCSYGNFLELIGTIFSSVRNYADADEGEYIPIIFGTNKDDVLRRAREYAIFDEPTLYPENPKAKTEDKISEKETKNNIVSIKKDSENVTREEKKKDE